MSNNIFTQIHTDRDGNGTPLVSLQADHLVNIVNLSLQKNITKKLRQAEDQARAKYAPEGMDEKVRRSLRKRRMTQEDGIKLQNALDELAGELQDEAFEHLMPYIVVGVCRDDTRDGIIAILQAVTGITGRVELPGLTNSVVAGELMPGNHQEEWEGFHGFGDDEV